MKSGFVINCPNCCGKENCLEHIELPCLYCLLNDINVDYLELIEVDETEHRSPEMGKLEWSSSMNQQYEDLLDIISEDGDYMARIGADYASKCVFCAWKGPILKLDHHFRMDHQAQTYKVDTNSFNGTFSIAGLLKQVKWNSMLIQTRSNGNLFLLSALYSRQNMLHVTLTTSCPGPTLMGSIAVHNKSTGKPTYWKGKIDRVPQIMTTKLKGLHVKLSQGKLLPVKSNGKILPKQGVFTDINITLYVKVNIP